MFRLHFSFVLCFIWKQLKGISSAVTKGEKMEMFYIGGNTDIISFLLCKTVGNCNFNFAEVLHTPLFHF